MRRGYGQYCPLALAAELLCERWTVLVISRVIDGCTQFNAIHRGVPRISPAMLTKRLRQLEHAGIVTSRPSRKGKPRIYSLTAAGQELAPLIDSLAVWGQRWARDMCTDDLDPGFLAWSMHTRLDLAHMPPGRTVLAFEFSGAPRDCRRFWLVNDDGKVDMCLKDPGYEVDLIVRSDLRQFIEAWRGIRDLRAEIRARHIELIGAPGLVRGFPDWLRLSGLAENPRLRPGRELRLMRSEEAGLRGE
ncbi:MAG TPA: helix-turn-helix domain-containing protein [Steroidobacteraceae bacterium]|nr:helix-turn-helix domain-containing protein [Steroidobacteraceae bacterium]